MIGKKMPILYGIAGGGIALVLACFFGALIEDSLQLNSIMGRLAGSPDRLECTRGYYNEELAYSSFDRDDPDPEDDRDSDRISDFWEARNDLNPEDSGDAEHDPDRDGYTNIEEYRANTNPWYSRHYPGVIPITTEGFDCFYTAEMGLINDDVLVDILIRDPSEGFLPAVRDFVMIQQEDHSFVIEEARNYEIPELTSIQAALWLTELNMDRSKDIALIGLSQFITDVDDQIIFGHSDFGDLFLLGSDFGVVPESHKRVDNVTHTFFRELFEWAYMSEDYFDERAPVLATVPEVLDLAWLRDDSGNILGDSQSLSQRTLPADCGTDLMYCFEVATDAGDPERLSANEIVVIDYTALPYEIGLSDVENDPREPDLHFLVQATFSAEPQWQVKDYSVFNQDALRLARNELRSVRYSGVIFDPSDEASAIFGILENYLGVPVFSMGYGPGGVKIRPVDWGVWPYELDIGRDERGKDTMAMGTVFYIRRVLDYISDRYIARPPHLYEQ